MNTWKMNNMQVDQLIYLFQDHHTLQIYYNYYNKIYHLPQIINIFFSSMVMIGE